MKHVTIVIPEGYANLSSIAGSFQILVRANDYWQKIGNKPLIDVRIAGFVPELSLDSGFFTIYPINIVDIEKTDLVIIPSVSHEYDLVIRKNKILID